MTKIIRITAPSFEITILFLHHSFPLTGVSSVPITSLPLPLHNAALLNSAPLPYFTLQAPSALLLPFTGKASSALPTHNSALLPIHITDDPTALSPHSQCSPPSSIPPFTAQPHSALNSGRHSIFGWRAGAGTDGVNFSSVLAGDWLLEPPFIFGLGGGD